MGRGPALRVEAVTAGGLEPSSPSRWAHAHALFPGTRWRGPTHTHSLVHIFTGVRTGGARSRTLTCHTHSPDATRNAQHARCCLLPPRARTPRWRTLTLGALRASALSLPLEALERLTVTWYLDLGGWTPDGIAELLRRVRPGVLAVAPAPAAGEGGGREGREGRDVPLQGAGWGGRCFTVDLQGFGHGVAAAGPLIRRLLPRVAASGAGPGEEAVFPVFAAQQRCFPCKGADNRARHM